MKKSFSLFMEFSWKWAICTILPALYFLNIYNDLTLEWQNPVKYLGHLAIFIIINLVCFHFLIIRTLTEAFRTFSQEDILMLNAQDQQRSRAASKLYLGFSAKIIFKKIIILIIIFSVLTYLVVIEHRNKRIENNLSVEQN